MKKIILTVTACFISLIMLAQAPQKFNYQAVLRNASGEIIKDKEVNLKIEIISISDETVVYTETHDLTTNSFGLINTQIGTGETSDLFSEINWSQENYKVQVSFDSEGTNNYTILGEQQFSSVPYALFAVTSGDKQELSINGNVITLSDGGSVTLPEDLVNDEDADPSNEIQDLELVDGTLKITNNPNATEINLTPYTGTNTDEQTLSLTGTNLSIENGNSVDLSVLQDGVNDADADATNEIQTLTIVDNTIYLTSGGSVDLPEGFSGDYNDLTNLPDFSNFDDDKTDDFSGDYTDLINKPTLVGDVTGDLSNTTVEKIQGMEISNAIPANGQVLKWNLANSTWEPADDALGEAGSTDGVVTSATVTGTSTKIITLNRSNELGSITASFTDEINDADADATNEIQDLSLSGNILKITDNTSATGIDLSIYLDDTNTQLTETEVDNYVSNNGYLTAEVDGSVTNEIQDLSISGTTLSLSGDTTTVDLSFLQDGTGTDDQTISLSGNTLSIENGNSVNLSAYLDNTDAQDLSISGTTLSLTGDATTVDLSILQDGTGTDDQTISLSGNTLSIEDGNSVNLSAYLDNTDAQDLSISGTTLSLTGDVTTVDLSILQDGTGTDDQTISLSGNTLSIEDGNSVNLSAYLDNTDAQNLTLSGNTLSISNGNSVDLSALGGTDTDDQTLSLSGTTLSISEGNSVNLSSINTDDQTLLEILTADPSAGGKRISNINTPADDWDVANKIYVDTRTLGDILTYDNSAGNNKITFLATPTVFNDAATKGYVDANIPANQTLSLSGSTLYISSGNSVDLSSLGGGTDTDDQTLSLSGTTLSIADGNSVDLSSIDTKLNETQVDAYVSNNGYLTSEIDGSTTNEIQDLSLSGNTLSLSGDATTVNLSSYLDNTDAQTLSLSGTNLTISGGNTISVSSLQDGTGTDDQTISLSGTTLTIENGNSVSLSSLSGAFSTTSNVTSNASGLYSTDDFVFGSSTLDYNGTSTQAQRFFFDKSKAAFRAGTANSTDWDAINIGEYSFAAGFGSKASGSASSALGRATSATGTSAFSVGFGSVASGYYSFAQGYNATASAYYAVALGYTNTASANYAVAIGSNVQASGIGSFAMGNTVTSSGATSTAFGTSSESTGDYSFSAGYIAKADGISSVSLGYNTHVDGNYSAAIGYNTTVYGNNSYALGENATVDLSISNTTAIGKYARGGNSGSFVICDATPSSSFYSLTDNSFTALFSGGFYLYTNSSKTSGVYMNAGANSWSSISDSTKKENFKSVNGEEFLNKISKFNLTSWNYKGQDATKFRHYGPMAQDFYAAFGNDGIGTVGCDTLIATADFIGVNFIAIQALEKRTQELKNTQEKLSEKINEIDQLKSTISILEAKISEIDELKEELKKLMDSVQK